MNHSEPIPSSATPRICSRNASGSLTGTLIFPEDRYARPSEVTIQSTCFESSKIVLTIDEGKPSLTVRFVQYPFANEAKPLGVATHVVPSKPSTMELTPFDGRPLESE